MTTVTAEATQATAPAATTVSTASPTPSTAVQADATATQQQPSSSKTDSLTDKVLRERDEAVAKLREIQAASEQAERDKAIQNKDVETLQKKHASDLQAREQQIKVLQQSIATAEKNATVKQLVSDIFLDKHRRVAEALIKDRIGATVNEKGEPQLIIKDKDGNVTKLTLDQFRKEIESDKELEDYRKGAAGSGAIPVADSVQPLPSKVDSATLPRQPEALPNILKVQDSAKVAAFLKQRIANKRR